MSLKQLLMLISAYFYIYKNILARLLDLHREVEKDQQLDIYSLRDFNKQLIALQKKLGSGFPHAKFGRSRTYPSVTTGATHVVRRSLPLRPMYGEAKRRKTEEKKNERARVSERLEEFMLNDM